MNKQWYNMPLRYGHCRCCLEVGDHRDITTVYKRKNSTEVYEDIILNCFNIFLSSNTNLSTLICKSCVVQLVQADEFRKLILETERKLLDELQKCHSDQMVLVNVPVPTDTLHSTVGFQIRVPRGETESGELIQPEEIAEETLNRVEISQSPQLHHESSVCKEIRRSNNQSDVYLPAPDANNIENPIGFQMQLSQVNDRLELAIEPRSNLRQSDIQIDLLNDTMSDGFTANEPLTEEAMTHDLMDNELMTIQVSTRSQIQEEAREIPTRVESQSKIVGTVATRPETQVDGESETKDLSNQHGIHVAKRSQINIQEETEEFKTFIMKEELQVQMEDEVLDEEPSGPTNETEDALAPLSKIKRVESAEELSKISDNKKEKIALISNITTLLKNSNATFFKSRTRAGFPCFYCKEICKNLKVLRLHQVDRHSEDDLSDTLAAYSAEDMVVYADVEDLECQLCKKTINSLKEFKIHLIEAHGKYFFKKITDRVIPFKMFEDFYECQVCKFTFETFGAIEKHMNTHYRNYVCSICGNGFVTNRRLKAHLNLLHKEGRYPCGFCDKVFNTPLKLKGHVDFVHRMLKKVKCHKCLERFSDYFIQKKHMVDVHGETPIVYKCNVCGKGFKRRYTLSCHMKVHLNLKDVKCDLCSYSCYSRSLLREHMFKHKKSGDDSSRTCSVCDKAFSRSNALRKHMKTHLDVAKCKCKFCGLVLDQSALKVHMKRNHSQKQRTKTKEEAIYGIND